MSKNYKNTNTLRAIQDMYHNQGMNISKIQQVLFADGHEKTLMEIIGMVNEGRKNFIIREDDIYALSSICAMSYANIASYISENGIPVTENEISTICSKILERKRQQSRERRQVIAQEEGSQDGLKIGRRSYKNVMTDLKTRQNVIAVEIARLLKFPSFDNFRPNSNQIKIIHQKNQEDSVIRRLCEQWLELQDMIREINTEREKKEVAAIERERKRREREEEDSR